MGSDAFTETTLIAIIAYLRCEIEIEEYDRTLPGFWFRDKEWIPRGDVIHLSRQFALSKKETLKHDLKTMGIPTREQDEAKKYVKDLSFERQKTLLKELAGR